MEKNDLRRFSSREFVLCCLVLAAATAALFAGRLDGQQWLWLAGPVVVAYTAGRSAVKGLFAGGNRNGERPEDNHGTIRKTG